MNLKIEIGRSHNWNYKWFYRIGIKINFTIAIKICLIVLQVVEIIIHGRHNEIFFYLIKLSFSYRPIYVIPIKVYLKLLE